MGTHHYQKYYRRKIKKKNKNALVFSKIIHSSYFWGLLFFLSIGSIIIYFLFFSSIFQIKNIEVSGNQKSVRNKIEEVISSNLKVKIGAWQTKSIFLINLGKAEKNLLVKFPVIAKVNFKKKLPNSLLVNIEERKAVAVFCQDNNCFSMDGNGIIFEKLKSPLENKILIVKKEKRENIYLGKTVLQREIIQKIIKIKKKLGDDLLNIPLKSVTYFSGARLNVLTSHGWKIYFNFKKNLEWQIAELSAILEKIPAPKRKNLKYIDLRFNKVYIFPEGLLN